MYSLSQIRRGLAAPGFLGRELNRLYHRRLYTRPYNTAGVSIFDEDWDNLIILDACRYDMFAEQSTLDGDLQHRQSRGSSTVEFLRANFDGRDLRDTVYVTANPQLYRNRDTIETDLHAVIDVWEKDGWDEEHKTVLPETMVEYVREATLEYPDKRVVSHFIQPHYPFLYDESVFDDSQAFLRPEDAGSWDQVLAGKISVTEESLWKAYRATLDRALAAVEELLETVAGKTVVTADHGNMVGERARPVPIRDWGHPHGIYTEQLVKVPWLVIEDGTRREITAEKTETNHQGVDDTVVEDRLETLGYR